jgi:hypothetical protein
VIDSFTKSLIFNKNKQLCGHPGSNSSTKIFIPVQTVLKRQLSNRGNFAPSSCGFWAYPIIRDSDVEGFFSRGASERADFQPPAKTAQELKK